MISRIDLISADTRPWILKKNKDEDFKNLTKLEGVLERYILSSMASNNGLSYDGLTPRTETTAQTTMANGGAHQLFFFLLTPEKVLVIFVLVIGTIFVNRILRPR